MKDEQQFEFNVIISVFMLILIFLMVVLTFRYRNTEDRLSQMEIELARQRNIRIISEYQYRIEPSDDEIIITINGEE